MTSSREAVGHICRRLGIDRGRAESIRRALVGSGQIARSEGRSIAEVAPRDFWRLLIGILTAKTAGSATETTDRYAGLRLAGIDEQIFPASRRSGPRDALTGLAALIESGSVPSGTLVVIRENDPEIAVFLPGAEPFVYRTAGMIQSELSSGYRKVHELHGPVLNLLLKDIF